MAVQNGFGNKVFFERLVELLDTGLISVSYSILPATKSVMPGNTELKQTGTTVRDGKIKIVVGYPSNKPY